MSEIQWGMFTLALILCSVGIAFVYSATIDPAYPGQWGTPAKKQLAWFIISTGACLAIAHIPIKQWQENAWVLYGACILFQLFMFAAAGSPLVPYRNGAHNWIALGPMSIQPSEFFKIAILISCASFAASKRFEAGRFSHIFALLGLAGIPALLLAKEDLGSAMTFLPMVLGILILAGIRFQHLMIIFILLASIISSGVYVLSSKYSDDYQWRRIDAWLNPDQYRQFEAFQPLRSQRSIGSGEWLGKGFTTGAQNRLGWLPEKRTDMIFAVVGEEIGFIGSSIVIIAFMLFGWAGLYASMQCTNRFSRLLICGFTSLIMGQMAINISVALGLIPVTGITLPFFSYGGSSLLAMFLGLGICLGASAGRANEFSKDVLDF
ncbi:MAG: rod shape-determining protein RodA [Planctomycetes bacterium]|nr:rod shape-determining protein RodA [Planctomycetota bacterium]